MDPHSLTSLQSARHTGMPGAVRNLIGRREPAGRCRSGEKRALLLVPLWNMP